MTAPPKLRLRTNAKINLFLRIASLRTDGYHELESVFHGISLFDSLEVELTDEPGLDVAFDAGPNYGTVLPTTDENSLTQTFGVLRDMGLEVEGARAVVFKSIPVGSGLGGGSANAAGLILGLNEMMDWGMSRGDLHDIAERVGSDVPYFISGGTMLALSRGEELQRLPMLKGMTFVLGMSHRPLLTRDVYAAFDELKPEVAPNSAPLIHALGAGDVVEVASLLYNDLERAALVLRPELGAAKAAMVEAGALGSGVSGSGPTVFGIAADRSSAASIAARIEDAFDRVEVVETAEACVEIVEGTQPSGL